ncbi:MAG: hypothetical protein KVP17_003429 [Porospora cf. gigantea B]|uniref:uncharacterized protein n=1 Tax=Porospora cf. gigantea B TaxID=2853592 RepID=UPI0035719A5F|nr:MAG: hypothetical protein KVP17_003429 [Porospora cf. gigantea B]
MCDGTPDPFMVMHVTSINTPRYWFNLFRHSITYALGFKTIDGPVHFWTNFVHLLMQAAQYFCLVYFVVLCIYSETRETLWAYILLVAINFCVAAYRATVVPHMAREVNYAISENVDFAALERPLEMKPACDFNKAWEGFPSSQHLLACEFGPPAPIWYQVFRRTNPMIGELRFAHRPKNLYERHMKWRAYYTNNWSSDVPNQTAPDLRLRWTLLRIGDFASYMKHYGIFRRPLEAAVKAETFTGRRFTRYFLLYLLMCAVPYNLNLTGLLGHPFAHVLSNRVLFQTFEGAHQNHYLEAVFAYLTMQQVFLLGVPLCGC